MRMEKLMGRVLSRACLLFLATVLFGCAGAPRQEPAVIGKDVREIRIEARSFAFEPSFIRLTKGQSVDLNVENVSDTMHNITIKDPRGKVMADVDLPPHKIETIRLLFPETGNYELLCDKPFHPTLGMKGSIEVIQ